MQSHQFDRREATDPADRPTAGDPLWLWGVVPWWLGFTLVVSAIADGRFPARGGLALAVDIAIACGLVVSGVCMVTAVVRLSRRR